MVWLDKEKDEKEPEKQGDGFGGIGKHLLDKRIIMLFGPIDKVLAQKIIAQLILNHFRY